jgi:hypothetical protein
MQDQTNPPSPVNLVAGREVILVRHSRNGKAPDKHVKAVLGSENRGRGLFDHAVTADGERLAFDWGPSGMEARFTDTAGETLTFYWTYPLPAWSADEQVAYARALRGNPDTSVEPRRATGFNDTAAFLIDEVADRTASARIVSNVLAWTREDPEEEDFERYYYKKLEEEEILEWTRRDGRFFSSTYRILIDRACLPPHVVAGMLVVATDMEVAVGEDNRAVTTLANAAILPRSATIRDLDGIFPERVTPHGPGAIFTPITDVLRLAPVAQHMHLAAMARHALDTDRAIAIVFPSEDGDALSQHFAIAATEGAALYADDGFVRDHLSYPGFPPGVRLLSGFHFWSGQCGDGEWDAGVDCDDEPATAETLASFHLDLDWLAKAIRGNIEADDRRWDDLNDRELAAIFLSGDFGFCNKLEVEKTRNLELTLP